MSRSVIFRVGDMTQVILSWFPGSSYLPVCAPPHPLSHFVLPPFVALSVQVAGLIFSVAVLAHSAKNQSACIEGFVALEGLYCVLQFPLSCGFVAFSQERAARRGAPPSKTA